MVVADLPAVQPKSSLTPVQDLITDYLAEGHPPGKIARALAKGDEKKAKVWRRRIRNWSYGDVAFQQALAMKAKGELILSVGETTKAVVKRAGRGRIDAAKLVYEASGFHNPRVQHEHSGDIKVTLDIPRPTPVDERPGNSSAGGPAEEVVDAEVLED